MRNPVTLLAAAGAIVEYLDGGLNPGEDPMTRTMRLTKRILVDDAAFGVRAMRLVSMLPESMLENIVESISHAESGDCEDCRKKLADAREALIGMASAERALEFIEKANKTAQEAIRAAGGDMQGAIASVRAQAEAARDGADEGGASDMFGARSKKQYVN